MTVYNKLVRDKIPAIITKAGKSFNIKTLDENEYKQELIKKLSEEIDEYKDAQSNEAALEELADILEVISALAETHGAYYEKLEAIRKSKAQERGGFQEKIYLIDVED